MPMGLSTTARTAAAPTASAGAPWKICDGTAHGQSEPNPRFHVTILSLSRVEIEANGSKTRLHISSIGSTSVKRSRGWLVGDGRCRRLRAPLLPPLPQTGRPGRSAAYLAHKQQRSLETAPLSDPTGGTSLIRNSTPLGPYSRTVPRALWGS